jgi:selenocysteine lyase/cysteine desulfurase
MQQLEAARAMFAPTRGYLNAATMGLPPRQVVSAMQDALLQWQAGEGCPMAYDQAVTAARTAYAGLVGVPTGQVAVGSQTSVFAGMVAASLPPGSEVLVVAEDFTSVVFPFLVQEQHGVRVRQVPRTELAGAVRAGTDLVVFSLAQSACGRLVDLEEVTDAARRHGALTFCDVTQAAGWFPLEADRFDLTVCSAYKWLCQPRGTAYLTVRPEVMDRLVPVNAGWYAGESVWESVYGPKMHLARDARRFDVSPAWLSWVGAAAAGEVFDIVPTAAVREHDVSLADALRDRLGMPPQQRPVVTVPDPDGRVCAALEHAGATVASRAGAVRLAFHLWNDADDVALAADAVRSVTPAGAPAR